MTDTILLDAKEADKIISGIENHNEELTPMVKMVNDNMRKGIRDTKIYSTADNHKFDIDREWIKQAFEGKKYEVYDQFTLKNGFELFVKVPRFDLKKFDPNEVVD